MTVSEPSLLEPLAKKARHASLIDMFPQEVLSHIASFLEADAFRTFRTLCRRTRDTIDLDARQWKKHAHAFLRHHLEDLSCVEQFIFLAEHLVVVKACAASRSSKERSYCLQYDTSLIDDALCHFDQLFHERNLTYGLEFKQMGQVYHVPFERLRALAQIEIVCDRDEYQGDVPITFPPCLKSLRLFYPRKVWRHRSISLNHLPTSLEHLEINRLIFQDFDGSALPPNLKSLTLSDCDLASFRNLQHLAKLEDFMVYSNDLHRLHVEQLPASLKALSVLGNDRMITPSLDRFEHLSKLTLGNTSFSDDFLLPNRLNQFETLAGLTLESMMEKNLPSLSNLRTVAFWSKELVTMPNVLSMLTQVKEVQIDMTSMECLSASDLPPQVESISASSNEKLMRLTLLDELIELKELVIRKSVIGNCHEMIVYPASLQHLTLQSCRIKALGNHQFPKGLRELNFANNSLAKLKSYTFTSDLQKLDLSDCSLRTIDGITFPDTLASLNLAQNKLASIEHARLPGALENLHLNGNLLISIENVKWPEDLKVLDVSSNKLTVVDYGRLPTRLVKLYLSYNHIASVKGDFERFLLLRMLRLGDNHLCSLKKFPLPPFVHRVDLSRNKFTTLEGLCLPNTTVSLNLSGNCFKSFGMPRLNPSLRIFDLSSCMIASFTGLVLNKQLRKLNLKDATCQSLDGLDASVALKTGPFKFL